MLSSPSCRATTPLLLRKMGILGPEASIKRYIMYLCIFYKIALMPYCVMSLQLPCSVDDILAEDIPPHLRHELKGLAGEIAGAMVEDLGRSSMIIY